MSKVDSLTDYLNELNQNGRIQYSDYSNLFDIACELGDIEAALTEARADIAALLWMNGNCEFCRHGRKEKFGRANRWICALGAGEDCHPEWRGSQGDTRVRSKGPHDANENHTSAPEQKPEKKSRVERMFGPKELWPQKSEPPKQKSYWGFLLVRCQACR